MIKWRTIGINMALIILRSRPSLLTRAPLIVGHHFVERHGPCQATVQFANVSLCEASGNY